MTAVQPAKVARTRAERVVVAALRARAARPDPLARAAPGVLLAWPARHQRPGLAAWRPKAARVARERAARRGPFLFSEIAVGLLVRVGRVFASEPIFGKARLPPAPPSGAMPLAELGKDHAAHETPLAWEKVR